MDAEEQAREPHHEPNRGKVEEAAEPTQHTARVVMQIRQLCALWLAAAQRACEVAEIGSGERAHGAQARPHAHALAVAGGRVGRRRRRGLGRGGRWLRRERGLLSVVVVVVVLLLVVIHLGLHIPGEGHCRIDRCLEGAADPSPIRMLGDEASGPLVVRYAQVPSRAFRREVQLVSVDLAHRSLSRGASQ
jgi:hypothetical protein